MAEQNKSEMGNDIGNEKGTDLIRSLPPRSAVPEQECWDLRFLYPTEADYQSDLEVQQQAVDRFLGSWKEKLEAIASAGTDAHATATQAADRAASQAASDHAEATLPTTAELLAMLADYEAIGVRSTRLMNYAVLPPTVDQTDPAARNRMDDYHLRASRWGADLSFVRSCLMDLPDASLLALGEADPQLASFAGRLIRGKKHRLSHGEERLLALLSPVLDGAENDYDITKLADMRFEPFTCGGKEWPLSYVLYENFYAGVPDADLRRAAFKAFSEGLRRYYHTTAAIYSRQILSEKILSEARGYASVFDYLLEDQRVPRELYDRQIDIIMEELSPHMRRYARLLKKTLGLDTLYYSDLKAQLYPDDDPSLTYDEAAQYVRDGLAVLGQDYLDFVMRAFPERWVDYASNDGKSTGGFCTSAYGLHSNILLSWNGQMSEVFTLVHELGHAAQDHYTAKARRYLDSELSLYSCEAPSTCNEVLLAQYLKGTRTADRRFQRWVRASQIANTYYHNFVTHFMEAAYQREVYRRVDQGEALTADDLSTIFREQLERFWGDGVVLDEGAELTWMRQPHYYCGLYSYTYSAGLTIGTAVAKRVERLGKEAVEDWKKSLAAGDSTDPIGFAALAGVDITTAGPLRETIAYIGGLIDEIEALS